MKLIKRILPKVFTLFLVWCTTINLYGQVTDGSIILPGDQTEAYTELEGEWLFYPETVHPHEIKAENAGIVKVPGSWEVGGRLKAFGYGLYHVKINNAPEGMLGLKLGLIGTAYKVWVDDQQLSVVGKPAASEDNFIPDAQAQVIAFQPEKRNFDLFILVSNYSHRKGGIHAPVYIGTHTSLNQLREKTLFTDGMLLAFIFAIALFSLVAYGFDRSQDNFLYFGFFCLCVVTRLLVIDEVIIKLLWPAIPYWLLSWFQYVGFILMIGFVGFYQKSILNGALVQKVSGIFFKASVIGSLAVICTPSWINSYISLVYQAFSFIGIGLVYYFYIKAWSIKDWLMGLLMLGFTAIIISFIHDVLAANGLVKFDYWQSYGFAFYAVVQAVYFGVQYKSLNQRVKNLHSDLLEYGLINRKKEEYEQQLISELKSLKALETANKEQVQTILKKVAQKPEMSSRHKVTLDNLEKFNTEFVHQLRKRYPQLTDTEQELCILLKAKLSNKEIAAIRNIHPDSVKKAKLRLRKKLELESSTDLVLFLEDL